MDASSRGLQPATLASPCQWRLRPADSHVRTLPLSVCDEGWGEVFDKLRAAPHAQAQLATWLPPSSGLQEMLARILREHPAGFQPATSQRGGEAAVVDDVEQDIADWELHRHVVLHQLSQYSSHQ